MLRRPREGRRRSQSSSRRAGQADQPAARFENQTPVTYALAQADRDNIPGSWPSAAALILTLFNLDLGRGWSAWPDRDVRRTKPAAAPLRACGLSGSAVLRGGFSRGQDHRDTAGFEHLYQRPLQASARTRLQTGCPAACGRGCEAGWRDGRGRTWSGTTGRRSPSSSG